MVSEAWSLFTQGSLIEAILSVYTEPMGFWFFIVMYAAVIMMIFMRTEKTTVPLIISLIINGIFMTFAPAGSVGVAELLTLSQVLFAITAAGIVYKIYKAR